MSDNLASKMDLARKPIIQDSAGLVNSGGIPLAETLPFKVAVRMITPGDVVAVTSARDVGTVARGLRGIIAGAKMAMKYNEK